MRLLREGPGALLPARLGPRLALLLVMSAGLSAALAMVAMLVSAWLGADRHARSEARQAAATLAYSVSAPLAFDDAAGVREALGTLGARADILAAWVRDADGRLIQAYGPNARSTAGADGGSLRQKRLVVSAPVFAGNRQDRIGTVTLSVDLSRTWNELRWQAIVAGLAALCALLVTVVLSQRLARRISIPIVQLAHAARAMTVDWHSRKPLPVNDDGEIGMAIKAFNRMVEELERRDSALQQLNAELRASAEEADLARQQAEAASVAKTRFLANMSHELRSPLNGVIGAAQLLEAAGENAARRAELVRIIRTSGNNLLDMIENVLDIARIEAGNVQVERRPFDLIESVEAALAPTVPLAVEKGLQLSFYFDPAVPRWCSGDAARLRQLIQNLLGNALKFTERGRIAVEVRRAAEPGFISIAVQDTGIGISGAQHQGIFEPFRQVDPSATRRYGGSGLGLAICRDVARLMGGEVSVRSEPGKGSEFTLHLPLPEVPAVSAQTLLSPRPQVVCIEPDEKQCRAVAALLSRLGCAPRNASDIASLEQALGPHGRPGSAPTVVLLATDHPGFGELAQHLREQRPEVVVLGLGLEGGRSPLSGALTRPVMFSALEAALHSALGRGDVARTGLYRIAGSATGTYRGLVLQPATTRARVLVVEDDPVNQIIVRSMVEPAFDCIVAGSGDAALRHLSGDRFDAVIMDWQMPDMDGLEVTRRLRAGLAGELNRTVPVIALTANAFAEDRNTCLAAGMNDFMTKPVQASKLVATLHRWCRTEPMQPEPARAEGEATRPVDVVFDRAVLASLPMIADGSSPGRLQELLSLFMASTRSGLDELPNLVAAGNQKSVQRFVHTLKSSAGQVGARALSALAASMEKDLRAGGSADPAIASRLREEFLRFEAAAGAAVHDIPTGLSLSGR